MNILKDKKKVILIFVPILVVLIVLGILVGNLFKNKENKDNIAEVPTYQTSYTVSKVYLADKDNTLIPLSIKYQSFDSVGEELVYLLTQLKENSSISTSNFNGLIPSDATIKSLELANGIVSVNYDEKFLNYEKQNELKILESLVWTLCDYNGVEGVSLYVNDELLTNMPMNNTPINKVLTRQIGINNYLLTSSIIQKGERVLSYYEKEINDKYYYVPVTHYVSNLNDLSIYDLTIMSMFTDPGITSSLEVCRCLTDTSMVTSSILTDNILYLSLTEDILFDEATVSLDIYNLFKEVTILLEEVKDVSFLMELEEVPVNGIENEENKEVSVIELNKFYI